MSVAVQGLDEVHAVKCDLAAEVLRSSGSLRLRVMGSSMLPSVWPGDTLLIERVPVNAVSTGDLVLFGRDRRLFVHRVVSVGSAGDATKDATVEATILTRGDAMPQTDPPVPSRDLLGRVAYIVRDGKLIEPKKSLGLPQRAIATLVQRSEIAARVAIGLNGMVQNSRRQNSNPISTKNSNQIPNQRVVPCQS
jgi:signal peptidase I